MVQVSTQDALAIQVDADTVSVTCATAKVHWKFDPFLVNALSIEPLSL
jgi:hypothetical protein